MPIHRFVIRPLALALAFSSASVGAATFTVTRGDDPAPNGCLDGDCSLREAVDATAATPEADTILLAAGQYQLTIDELAIGAAITIRGAGSATTRVTGTGDFDLFHVLPFGDLTVESVVIGSTTHETMEIEGGGAATLHGVDIPEGAGPLGTLNSPGLASISVEGSTIGTALVCFSVGGTCRILDSRVHELLVGESAFEMRRSELDGENDDTYGITIASNQPVIIEDSTIRRTSSPLTLYDTSDTAPAVDIRRTRFLDNTGPLLADRVSYVYMDEVEFRSHVVDDDSDNLPAVLLAGPGPIWSISRALIAGNRGGNGDGGAVRIIAGGRAIFDNSTFYDNTFRSDLGGYGDTIGVYNANASPAIAWLIHATLSRALSLPDSAVGSVLTSRGVGSDVRVFNSALRGSCAFSSGGALATGLGNVEAGDTCDFDPATNQVDVSTSGMFLTQLEDHGGFTETMYPNLHSPLRDSADAGVCELFSPLDQRRYVRPADGVGCDVGAVEALSISDSIFANSFDGQ